MFLDNLKKYFRLRDAKEQIKPEYSSPRNEYYGKVSERFSTAQMILYVVLTIFVLVSLMINSEWIKYENFYYFFSNMGNYITDSDSDIEDVIYKEDRQQSFVMYGDKFGVAGNSGVKLYTSSGRLIINDYDEIKKLSNPKLEASDRYLLMYDMGSGEFRVYNIFTKIFAENTEYPIYGADVSDSGSFALITKTKDSKVSAIDLYSDKFEKRRTYKIENAVDVSVSASGNEIAVVSYSVENQRVCAKIAAYKVSNDTPFVNFDVMESSFPLYCEFTSKNNVLVVCDNAVRCYGIGGNIISNITLEKEIVCANVNEHGAALVLSLDNSYSLAVFDEDGREIYNETLDTLAESVLLCEDSVFVDTPDSIIKIDVRTGASEHFENSDFGAVMLAKNSNELFVCLPSRVKHINFD